jgi:hypothetical protein
MVCLPLVDVKFNFAVLWVKWSFLRANIFWGESGAIADSKIPQLLGSEFTKQPPPVRTDYFLRISARRHRKRI